MSKQDYTWEEAKNATASLPMCCGVPAHLVSIVDVTEDEYVIDLLNSKSCTYGWLGLTYNKTSTKYSWLDGTPFNYSNFLTGNYGPTCGCQGCAAIDAKSGGWVTSKCSSKYKLIAEYDCNATKTS